MRSAGADFRMAPTRRWKINWCGSQGARWRVSALWGRPVEMIQSKSRAFMLAFAPMLRMQNICRWVWMRRIFTRGLRGSTPSISAAAIHCRSYSISKSAVLRTSIPRLRDRACCSQASALGPSRGSIGRCRMRQAMGFSRSRDWVCSKAAVVRTILRSRNAGELSQIS